MPCSPIIIGRLAHGRCRQRGASAHGGQTSWQNGNRKSRPSSFREATCAVITRARFRHHAAQGRHPRSESEGSQSAAGCRLRSVVETHDQSNPKVILTRFDSVFTALAHSRPGSCEATVLALSPSRLDGASVPRRRLAFPDRSAVLAGTVRTLNESFEAPVHARIVSRSSKRSGVKLRCRQRNSQSNRTTRAILEQCARFSISLA